MTAPKAFGIVPRPWAKALELLSEIAAGEDETTPVLTEVPLILTPPETLIQPADATPEGAPTMSELATEAVANAAAPVVVKVFSAVVLETASLFNAVVLETVSAFIVAALPTVNALMLAALGTVRLAIEATLLTPKVSTLIAPWLKITAPVTVRSPERTRFPLRL